MGKPRVNLEDFSEMLNFGAAQGKEAAECSTVVPASVQEQGSIQEMDFAQMEPFPNHKFKLYEGQQLAGLSKGPVIVREHLAYDEAVLIVTETNLRQRSFGDMSHSERAYCLAQHYEALKSQGRRNDLLDEIEMLLNPHESSEISTSSQVETKLRSDEKLGGEYGLSHAKVARYIRLARLNAKLLEKVDTGKIAFLAAYDLSFIEDVDRQRRIADLMESDNYKLDMKKAQLLRSYFETGKLNDTSVVQILSGEKMRKAKVDRPQPFKVRAGVITKYFTAGQSMSLFAMCLAACLIWYIGTMGKEELPVAEPEVPETEVPMVPDTQPARSDGNPRTPEEAVPPSEPSADAESSAAVENPDESGNCQPEHTSPQGGDVSPEGAVYVPGFGYIEIADPTSRNFEYCEIMRRQDIAIAEVRKAGLSKEQYIVVDKAISETNEYARILSVIAYKLGLQDGIRLKREVREI